MLPRHRVHGLAAAVMGAGLLASFSASAQAQSDYSGEDARTLVLSVHGGQYGPLTHLDDDSWVEFKTGLNLGGGVGYRFNRHVALRGQFTFIRAELRDSRPGARSTLTGESFHRYVYDCDLQLRYPLHTGLTPYAFLGGGVVTVRRGGGSEQPRFSKPAVRVGGGLSYQFPRSDVGVYVQGAGWIYEWDRYGFDNIQVDTTLSGGISYRFGL